MSQMQKMLQEVIDKLMTIKSGGSSPAKDIKDVKPEGLEIDVAAPDADDSHDPDSAKMDALKALAGEGSPEEEAHESPEDEALEEKMPMKHNHPIMEACGADCPMKAPQH